VARQVEERRAAFRYNLALPVEIRLASKPDAAEAILAETQDISVRGLYFNIAQKFPVGTEFEFSITVPIEITRAAQVNISGKARAVRVEETGKGDLGVGAVIERYQVSRGEL
jgi:PilZ domain